MNAWRREKAAAELHLCGSERHWITTPTCDSCWVSDHRCPPTLAEIKAVLRDVAYLQKRAELLRKRLGAALGGEDG